MDCLHAVIKITEISKELYPNVKHIIKSMKNKGHACTLYYFADTLNFRRGTVSEVIVRFKKKGSTKNKPRSGRLQR